VKDLTHWTSRHESLSDEGGLRSGGGSNGGRGAAAGPVIERRGDAKWMGPRTPTSSQGGDSWRRVRGPTRRLGEFPAQGLEQRLHMG